MLIGPAVIVKPSAAVRLNPHLRAVRVAVRHDPEAYGVLREIAELAAAMTDDGQEDGDGPWTVRRLALAAHLSPRSVRRHCETGVVPAVRVGRQWCISDRAARDYIKEVTSA